MYTVQAEHTIANVNPAYIKHCKDCMQLFLGSLRSTRSKWSILRPHERAPYEEDGIADAQLVLHHLSKGLGVIQELTSLDFSHLLFCDLTGSAGRALLAAGMLFRWRLLRSVELSESRQEQARMLLSVAKRGYHNLYRAETVVDMGNCRDWDLVDSDVVFIDATTFHDAILMLSLLISKLEDLVSGSFVIIATNIPVPMPFGSPFKLLSIEPSSVALDPAPTYVAVYQTVMASKDSRTRVELACYT